MGLWRLLRADLRPKTRPTNPYTVGGLEDGGEEIRYQAVEGDGPLKMGRAGAHFLPGILNI